MALQLALKIDVDTYRGIAEGAGQLARFLHAEKIPASFFVTLGPDNSGWAATRVFRHAGFFKKMQRTSALSLYGWRTALSGTLLPARPMAASFQKELRAWRALGFEVSPHGYDHIRWHDGAARWDERTAVREWEKITRLYQFIFGSAPTSSAAPGWQTNPAVWQAMEAYSLQYHSDTRGDAPYWPTVDGRRLGTPEIPTTLSTWDELLAREGMGPELLAEKTYRELRETSLNVLTVHAEVEGTVYFGEFCALIRRLKAEGVRWAFLPDVARELHAHAAEVPSGSVEQGVRPGRAGTVTCQTA